VTAADEFEQREEGRIRNYLSRFEKSTIAIPAGPGRLLKRSLLLNRTVPAGTTVWCRDMVIFIPRNVMIGQDSQENRDTLFVAAIDFGSSLMLPPAFDVGTFLAQYRNQLFSHQELLSACRNQFFWKPILMKGHRWEMIFSGRWSCSGPAPT
jgi:3',5'-nucleoside bisphosphate phosphatase